MILSSTKQKYKNQTHTFSASFLMPNFTLSLLMPLLPFLGTTWGYAQFLWCSGWVVSGHQEWVVAVSTQQFLSAPVFLLLSVCSTMASSRGSQGIYAPAPGAPLPPPSALTLMSVGLLLTLLYLLLTAMLCFFPFLNMFSQRDNKLDWWV